MTGEHGELAEPGEALRQRNRETLAKRLGYPDGTVEAEREIEAALPGYCAWYSDGTLRHVPPRYGARRAAAHFRDPTFYGASPAEVVAEVQAYEAGQR